MLVAPATSIWAILDHICRRAAPVTALPGATTPMAAVHVGDDEPHEVLVAVGDDFLALHLVGVELLAEGFGK